MTQRKIRFKDRIKRNDQKMRHKMASGMRKRMGVTRRTRNQFDHTDTDSRPMDEILADIAEGTAVPTLELGLDPRSLTDLLMTPVPTAGSGGTPDASLNPPPQRKASGFAVSTLLLNGGGAETAVACAKPQLPSQLPEAHPLAVMDMAAIEAEERRRRQEEEALKVQQANKNQYRHAGQPYVFWERVGVHPAILRALRDLRFSHPTPVQQEVLSHVLDPNADAARRDGQGADDQEGAEGGSGGGGAPNGKRKKPRKAGAKAASLDNTTRDTVVSAETGSGKTLVFAIPVLNDLLRRLDEAAAAAGKAIPIPPTAVGTAATPSGNGKGEEVEEGEGPRPLGTRKDASLRSSLKRSRSADRATADDDDGNHSGASPKKKKQRKSAAKQGGTAVVAAAAAGSSPAPSADPYVEDRRRRLMHTLIVSPTRELALQIKEAFDALTKYCPHVSVGCIVGGMAQEKQQRVLNRHPHVLVCTPGRLWDLVETNEGCYLGHSISRRLHYVVLDEADKLLQSGRFEQLKGMLERIHCETLPAGFVQDREEGAEVGELDLEAGRWDEERQEFVPFTKEEKATTARKTEDGHRSSDEPDGDEKTKEAAHKAKDRPRPIPMPASPADSHRVITYVTSATLSLQTNYERRDYKSDKKVIRTSNADVLGKVLQQLEIKPSNANVFTLSSQADVAAKINETFLRCPERSKDLYLYYFLRTYRDDRTIVFVNAISMLRRLVKVLEALGIAVVGLHASMQQRQRLKFIESFKAGSAKVLVATDIASRGLDIDGLKYVLHYQVPRTTEAYIHRCGRTARCGGTGLSLLLVDATEYVSFRKLMASLGRKETDMDTFALQPTVVHQLHAHLRIALQIDRLQKEVDKSKAADRWVDRMNAAAELETDDMKSEETAEVNREKAKAIKALKRELELLQKKFTGAHGGKGAFRTSAQALGAKKAEEKLCLRADHQTLRVKKRSQ